MLIGNHSKYLLKKTRAKAKMIEYNIPEEQHIYVEKNVSDLFLIAVAAIGNISTAIIRNKDESDNIISKSKTELEFASKYFDAYLNSNLDDGADDYYLLLGSVAYFFCDYIGSSKVLINKINIDNLNLNAHGIENALAILLKDLFDSITITSTNEEYYGYLKLLQFDFQRFFKEGKIPNSETEIKFRKAIYRHGSDLELLLVDAFCAIYYLKILHSAIYLLPAYTKLDVTTLYKTIFTGNLVKEMWPAQRKLGEQGVFAGNSSVVQMPTSSGKTKSVSIVIASAFLSGRANLAVVVAPFRALAREICLDLEKDFKYDSNIHINEMSDILQPESFDIDQNADDEKTVIIATPEKLIYLLRQQMDLIDKIGLIIFDEGHLFDEPGRGIVYELLMSTIKSFLPQTAQKILVSAVIPNASELNDWLNGDSGVVITDNTIKSTQKTIAFTDWEVSEGKWYGYLYFVDPENPNEEEFYVPRLIPIIQLNKLGKERNTRVFPEVDLKNSKVKHNDVAIYYGLKLCSNGGIAIFCGKKDTANNILKRILDIENRGYPIISLLNCSSPKEVDKICNLIEVNYGKDNIYYLAATKAAFVHHAGISNGIKVSIEYAMKKKYQFLSMYIYIGTRCKSSYSLLSNF